MFDFIIVDDIDEMKNRGGISERKRYYLSCAEQFYSEADRLYKIAEQYKKYALAEK